MQNPRAKSYIMASSSFVISSRRPSNLLLGAIVSLPTMAMTLIAPAVPALRQEFAISYNQAQLVITAFLIAMAVGLLLVGLLSDRFGRRPVLLIGTTLFFIASVVAYLAPSANILIIARAVQGLSAASLMTMGRIIANDLHAPEEAARALSSVTAFQTIVPILSLGIGGIIVSEMGWRATLAIMALASAIVFAQSLFLIAESNKNPLKTLPIGVLTTAFKTVLSSRMWRFYSICAGMQIGMFYSMNGYMPYHFARLGASVAEFGFFYAMVSVGYFFGNLVNRFYGPRLSLGGWVLFGSWITLIVLPIIWALDASAMLSPALLSFLLSLIGFSHGILVANAITISLQGSGQHKGSASGIGSAMHMVIGAISGSIIISLGGASIFWICIAINTLMAAASIVAAQKALKI